MRIIQECSSFITSNGYNWCNSCDSNTTYIGKTVNFRHRINNNLIIACHYGTCTDKFDNHVFKCINKNEDVAKEPYFKVYAFMIDNNENKLLCHESYLHKIRFDTINCYLFYCYCCCCLYKNDLYYRNFTLLEKSWNAFTDFK